MTRALKTNWDSLTVPQVVAALARRGFDRSLVRSACAIAQVRGYANTDAQDGSLRALITYGNTEVDAWDVQTFDLPVNRVQIPAAYLMIGMVFFLTGSNGAGRYRVTSVRKFITRGVPGVAVDWEGVSGFGGGGKGWDATDMVTIDAQATPSTAYVPNRYVWQDMSDARRIMHRAHTLPTPRMQPAQRDTRYPAGSWVWVPARVLYAQVLRTPDTRESSVVLYVPSITGMDYEGYDTGDVIAQAVTFIAPKTDVMPGANVGRGLSDRGASNVVYALRSAFTVGDMRTALGPVLSARYVPASLSDDTVIPHGMDVADLADLGDGWVCAPCAYAIGYAEWPGDWTEDDVNERDAQVAAATEGGNIRFVIGYDSEATLRDDTCEYHGERFVGTMYAVTMTRI